MLFSCRYLMILLKPACFASCGFGDDDVLVVNDFVPEAFSGSGECAQDVVLHFG